MGYYMSKLWQIGRSEREVKIVITGLHNAGKTTLLYKLALGEIIVTEPTIGSNVETLNRNGLRMQVWDLGGQENLRQSWDAYYQKTHAVIFVVDASDLNRDSVQTSKMEFHNLLLNQDLRNACILVFANKSDLPNALDAGDLIEMYALNDVRTHELHLQVCSAITGHGLQEGLDWIAEMIKNKKENSGQNVKALGDSSNRANLSNLTIKTEMFSEKGSERPKFEGNKIDLEKSIGKKVES
jgi:ADP-ribosylation factor-like protein 5B